ncbi:MAG TPA: ferredoxin, partial [Candidatus Limnocylindrales bacterium]|nr:ferredoxin [Candidatus Limnocylindrales bacterium]
FRSARTARVGTSEPATMRTDLVVDRIACDGFGMCAELLPELIELDDWGYPIVAAGGVPDALLDHAKRAVAVCPVLALRLARVPIAPPERGAAGWLGNRSPSVRR